MPSIDDKSVDTNISGPLDDSKHCREIVSDTISAQYTQLFFMSKSMAITFFKCLSGSVSEKLLAKSNLKIYLIIQMFNFLVFSLGLCITKQTLFHFEAF